MTLRYATAYEPRDYRCPCCGLFLQRKSIGIEVVCPNCRNTIKAHDHGGGDFTFEVWTGETTPAGDKEWMIADNGGQTSRVL